LQVVFRAESFPKVVLLLQVVYKSQVAGSDNSTHLSHCLFGPFCQQALETTTPSRGGSQTRAAAAPRRRIASKHSVFLDVSVLNRTPTATVY